MQIILSKSYYSPSGVSSRLLALCPGWRLFFRMVFIIALIVIGVLTAAVMIFLRFPRFGHVPVGERLAGIGRSANFKEGRFSNQSPTPDLTEGVSYYSVLKEFAFKSSKRGRPAAPLPVQKTDLHALNAQDNVLVWMGHSSYYLQVDGKKILVDPVLSGAASPVSFTTRSFAGVDIYNTDDIPELDILFLSHDHWDHLDYNTVKRLLPKVKLVITGLGTGEHLERWGFDTTKVVEKDWDEIIDLGDGFRVITTPARHFSGRGLARNRALWLSFILQTPGRRIFIGGDSGYDAHFKQTGAAYGPFDLAILECEQYDKSWKYIHMMPEETAQAAQDLGAKALMPVHWGKFKLGNHDWDDSIIRVSKAAQEKGLPLITPMIGEAVNLDQEKTYPAWWEGLA